KTRIFPFRAFRPGRGLVEPLLGPAGRPFLPSPRRNRRGHPPDPVTSGGSLSTNAGPAKDPPMHAYRTHTCGDLRASDVGTRVRLSGWVHRSRDHGGLLFIDLRDHYGITQCVIEPDSPGFARVAEARSEWVLTLTGPIVARTPETINPDLPTGEIELRIGKIAVQSQAGELPLPVFCDLDYPEETRLRYRFLDLRRE